MQKGQTTIELLLILGISMLALSIVYGLYASQVNTANEMNHVFIAKSTAQNIVNAANTVYFSGSGSEIKVEIELPQSVVLSESGIIGQTVFIRVAGNSEAIAVADVNIDGSFKERPGKYVVYMLYDGNVVHMFYRDYELNKYSISFSALSDTNYEDSIIIRNNSSKSINFWVTENFSQSDVTLQTNIPSEFTINSGDFQTMDLNFSLSENASGNYSGTIVLTGEVEDKNVVRTIYVSAEALTKIEPIMIYPKTTSFTTDATEHTETKSFSVCNKSLLAIADISWSAPSSQIDTWIESLPSISSVSAGDCEYFDINFNIPSTDPNVYSGSIQADYNSENNLYSALIDITLN